MAAVTEDEVTYPFAQAREIVLDCYSSFSPELGALAKRFFDEHCIDAPVRPAKRGGAFCASAVPSVHPYVLLNYTSRRRDVLDARARARSRRALRAWPPIRASSTRARR